MIVSASLKIAKHNKGRNANTVEKIMVKARQGMTVVTNKMTDSGNNELRCQQLQFTLRLTYACKI
jgi:hypothetical protein